MKIKIKNRKVYLPTDKFLCFDTDNNTVLFECEVDTSTDWSYKLDVFDKATGFKNILDLTRSENIVSTVIVAGQVPNGKIQFQLRAYKDDLVYVSEIFELIVKESINATESFDPVPSEFAQVEARLNELNTHTSYPGPNGYWMIWDLYNHEYIESNIRFVNGNRDENALHVDGTDPFTEEQRETGRANLGVPSYEEFSNLGLAVATHANNENIHVSGDQKSVWNLKYAKPQNGIPKTDLNPAVQESLDKADAAILNSEKGTTIPTLDETGTIESKYLSNKLAASITTGLKKLEPDSKGSIPLTLEDLASKTKSSGIIVDKDALSVQSASIAEINAQNNNYKPITPYNLSYAVKRALAYPQNSSIWSDFERELARSTLKAMEKFNTTTTDAGKIMQVGDNGKWVLGEDPLGTNGVKIEFEYDSSLYKLRAKLVHNNKVISQTDLIDLPIEQLVISVDYDNETKELVITLKNGNITRIPLATLVSNLATKDEVITRFALDDAGIKSQSETTLLDATLDFHAETDPQGLNEDGSPKWYLTNNITQLKSGHFVFGRKYKIIFDENEYILYGDHFDTFYAQISSTSSAFTCLFIGNSSIVNSYPINPTNCDFILAYNFKQDFTVNIYTTSTAATHNIKVVYITESYKSIPSELIDEHKLVKVDNNKNLKLDYSNFVGNNGKLNIIVGAHNSAAKSSSFVGGFGNKVNGFNGFAIGVRNTTSNKQSIAVFGGDNTANGQASFVTGQNNVATGADTFMSGRRNQAIGNMSTTIGQDNVASGSLTFAGGNGSEANGRTYFAHGNFVIADTPSSTVLGYGNDPQDDSIFEIGNGLDEDGLPNNTSNDEPTTRQNAFRVTQDGIAEAQTGFKVGNALITEKSYNSVFDKITKNDKDIETIFELLKDKVYISEYTPASMINFTVPAGATGYAELQEVQGQCVVFNQIASKDNNGWHPSGVSANMTSDGYIQMSVEDVREMPDPYLVKGLTLYHPIIQGHKYFIQATLKNGTSEGGVAFEIHSYSDSSNSITARGANPFITGQGDTTVYGFGTASTSSDQLCIRFQGYEGVYHGTAFCKNPICVDLTEMFGAGKEPETLEACVVGLANAFDLSRYTLGEIQRVNIEKLITKTAEGTQIQEYNFPTIQLNSAGDVYDYIDFKERKLHRRIGVVDLGSLNWNRNGANHPHQFYSDLLPEAPAINTTNAIIKRTYTFGIGGYADTTQGQITLRTRAWISSDIFQDGAQVKQLLSDYVVYYELGEEVVEDLSDILPADNYIKIKENGRITFVATPNIPVKNKIEYMVKI